MARMLGDRELAHRVRGTRPAPFADVQLAAAAGALRCAYEHAIAMRRSRQASFARLS